jgi:hypothetical protein
VDRRVVEAGILRCARSITLNQRPADFHRVSWQETSTSQDLYFAKCLLCLHRAKHSPLLNLERAVSYTVADRAGAVILADVYNLKFFNTEVAYLMRAQERERASKARLLRCIKHEWVGQRSLSRSMGSQIIFRSQLSDICRNPSVSDEIKQAPKTYNDKLSRIRSMIPAPLNFL